MRKKLVTWYFHVDESAKVIYDMILGRDLLTELGLNLKFYDYVIEEYYVPFKGLTVPVDDMVTYEFKILDIGKITPE